MTVRIAAVTSAPLDLESHVTAVSHAGAGAVSTFVGMVRDNDPSVTGTVVGLDYQAHPEAASILNFIARAVADANPGTIIAISHRTGELAVGEIAVVAAASAAHRAQAFRACESLIERVKAELPVWKRELMADGSHTWVGL